MKRYCNYHPIASAKWHCDACHHDYCQQCIVDSRNPCPHCHHTLKAVSRYSDLPPFWTQASLFAGSLFDSRTLLVLTLVLALSFGQLGPGYLAFTCMGLALFICSAHGRFRAIARFREQADPKSLGLSPSDIIRVGLLSTSIVAVPVLLCAGIYLFAGALFAVILALLLTLIGPALLIVHLQHDELSDALSINALLQTIAQLSSAYGLLVLYLLTTVFAVLFLADFGAQYLPSLLHVVLVFVAPAIAMLLMFEICGYVIAQYGLEEAEEDNSAQHGPDPYQGSMTTVQLNASLDMALKDGEYRRAIELLEKELKRHSFSDLRREQLLKLMLAMDDQEGLERNAQLFLWLMLGRGRIPEAVQFLRQRRQYNQQFRLFDAQLSLDLAKQCSRLGEHKLVLWLAQDAHKRFDVDANVAELYLLTAKTLLLQFKQAKKARIYLNFVREQFEEPEIQNTVEEVSSLIHATVSQQLKPS